MRPFVSVVIPTYHNRDGAAAAARSVLRGSYPPDRYEVIVVDGASGDGTLESVAELEREFPGRVQALEVAPFGPSASRQHGARAAKGDILAFIDSDCVAADADWLNSGVSGLEANLGLGIAQGRTLPPPGAQIPARSRYVMVEGLDPAHHACNMFYRRSAFEAVGGFSKDYYFDVEKERQSLLSRLSSRLFRIHFVLHCSAEDTDLGWRVIDAGWGKTYCENALVYHEVRMLTPFWWTIDAAIYCSGIPRLARRHPGLRRYLYWGHFLSKANACFVLFALGFALALTVHSAALLLGAPYIWSRGCEPSHFWRGPLRLFRFLFYLPRDAATFAVLLYRSLKYRYVVL